MLLLQLVPFTAPHIPTKVYDTIWTKSHFSYISSRQNLHTVMLSAAKLLIDAIRNRFFVSLRMTAMVDFTSVFPAPNLTIRSPIVGYV